MATTYRIALLHKDLDRLAEEVECAVVDAAAYLTDIANLLEFSSNLSGEDIPQVVAYLANEQGSDDVRVCDIIDEAVRRDMAILPVVTTRRPDDIREQLPVRMSTSQCCALGEVMASTWQLRYWRYWVLSRRNARFLFHIAETKPVNLAEQLHTALVQRRFDVFLDRFSVEPGEDFQCRLEEDLGDKAFVLLLESSELCESQWVRHEIAYAHARRIEMLALTLPNCSKLVPTIDDAFRLRLSEDDVSGSGALSVDALEKTLHVIELAHARALRRRREQILGSVTEKLRIAGCTCHPVDDWCILATGVKGESALFWVTPRRPEPGDFYSLSKQHQRVTRNRGVARVESCRRTRVGAIYRAPSGAPRLAVKCLR